MSFSTLFFSISDMLLLIGTWNKFWRSPRSPSIHKRTNRRQNRHQYSANRHAAAMHHKNTPKQSFDQKTAIVAIDPLPSLDRPRSQRQVPRLSGHSRTGIERGKLGLNGHSHSALVFLERQITRKSSNWRCRPKPAGRGNYPISIVKATWDPIGCPVFGEQNDIFTASPC